IFFLYMLFMILVFVFFFFSSRRRHTRFSRDWSSDVCSSDLGYLGAVGSAAWRRQSRSRRDARGHRQGGRQRRALCRNGQGQEIRSEERRVGKEGRTRWSPENEKKNKINKGVRGNDKKGLELY